MGNPNMPLALHDIVKTGRPLLCMRRLYLWSVSTALCFVLAGAGQAQDSITIGSGLPTIEVHEEAAYYEVNKKGTTSTPQRPLFDPMKDTVKSQVLTLPPPRPVGQPSHVKPENQNERENAEIPAVIEMTIEEAEVTASRSGEPAPTARQSESEDVDNNNTSIANQPETNTPSVSTVEHELAAIPPADPVIAREETHSQTDANRTTSLTIIFADGQKELEATEKDKLSTFARSLLGRKDARLQLKSYASDINESPSGARRLSLARALAVRSFLIEAGVNSTRIDVRALGAKNERGPADRVDLVVAH